MISKLKRVLGLTQKRIHGHELVQKHEKSIVDKLRSLQGEKVIIEVGSQREAGSTLYFGLLSKENNFEFHTVDLNNETTEAAMRIVNGISKDFKAINDFGEKYLDNYSGPIALVYLDAFDIDGDWHSNNLRDWYKSAGTTLNNENCWKMHLDCAIAIKDKIVPGGYVVFDDVNPVDEKGDLILKPVAEDYNLWSGKGKTAIPYLLDNGFVLIDNQRSGALLQKI
jgi:hypothetical protein